MLTPALGGVGAIKGTLVVQVPCCGVPFLNGSCAIYVQGGLSWQEVCVPVQVRG